MSKTFESPAALGRQTFSNATKASFGGFVESYSLRPEIIITSNFCMTGKKGHLKIVTKLD